jgi:hypothetical protein
LIVVIDEYSREGCKAQDLLAHIMGDATCDHAAEGIAEHREGLASQMPTNPALDRVNDIL